MKPVGVFGNTPTASPSSHPSCHGAPHPVSRLGGSQLPPARHGMVANGFQAGRDVGGARSLSRGRSLGASVSRATLSALQGTDMASVPLHPHPEPGLSFWQLNMVGLSDSAVLPLTDQTDSTSLATAGVPGGRWGCAAGGAWRVWEKNLTPAHPLFAPLPTPPLGTPIREGSEQVPSSRWHGRSLGRAGRGRSCSRPRSPFTPRGRGARAAGGLGRVHTSLGSDSPQTTHHRERAAGPQPAWKHEATQFGVTGRRPGWGCGEGVSPQVCGTDLAAHGACRSPLPVPQPSPLHSILK